MINGLKLTVQGEVLKDSVAKRIRQHEEVVDRYRADLVMDPKDQTEDHPWLPETHAREHDRRTTRAHRRAHADT
jgi:hypothetical protein